MCGDELKDSAMRDLDSLPMPTCQRLLEYLVPGKASSTRIHSPSFSVFFSLKTIAFLLTSNEIRPCVSIAKSVAVITEAIVHLCLCQKRDNSQYQPP